jgi:aspartate kinase
MLLASGEQIAVALVALAVNSLGGKARPLLAHQLGILTDRVYSKARIRAIQTDLLREELARGVIPVIAGFQGVDEERNITTLGRGGSDTSAVAIAAALEADDCEIYTDVEGVYTADPRLCARARKLEAISYDEMMELASLGAKVLQIRSVELAAKYGVPLHVRSSFNPVPGTRVVARSPSMEQILVSGVAADANEAQVSLNNLPEGAGIPFEVFGPIAEAAVVVDVIVQNSAAPGRVNLSFTVPEADLANVMQLLQREVLPRFPDARASSQTGLAKVSIVGVGMRNHPGVAAKMFRVLADAGIAVKIISTSEIKVSVLVERDRAREAVQKLHSAFGLDEG